MRVRNSLVAIDSPTPVAGAHGIFGKQNVEPLPDLAVRCRVDVVGVVAGEDFPDSHLGRIDDVGPSSLLPLALRPAVGDARIEVFAFHER